MMMIKFSVWTRGVVGMVAVCSLTGCFSVKPATEAYTFVKGHPIYEQHYEAVYSLEKMNTADSAKVVFTSPADTSVKFRNGGTVQIADGVAPRVVELLSGVYPFQIARAVDKTTMLSGAMMVYNMDRTTALATLGKTAETRLFNDELFGKAMQGQLATYTISFDGKEIITYWLGNRRHLDAGGMPTVELDFSETPGITQLKIGSGKPKNFVQTVPVFVVKKEDGIERQEPAEYSIHFACGSRQYHGYIRNLKDNEFTAFVRIPCAIPEKLLDAASRGTVSKFKVQSTGDRQEEVAEIVISGM
jgi:hypothetical protein